VVESGAGYTLSGKPLDPDSAAAKPYLRGWVPKNLIDQGKDTVPINHEKVIKEKKRKKIIKKEPSFHLTSTNTEYVNTRPLRQRKTAFDPIAVAMKG
jgi:hypothetical protein